LIRKIVISLASNSPRRRQLLTLTGWMFHIVPVDVDETPQQGETPQEYVLRLAEAKARAALPRLRPDGLVLAADTTVADRGEILGKPAHAAEAVAMLQRLRGRTHQVHTAIAVILYGQQEAHTDLCTTDVPMRNYTDEEIAAYVASADPFDKAGGYAIQNPHFQPVAHLQGCYANVVGLPLCHLTRTLNKLDILPRVDVPRSCQTFLQYDCPVYEQVLHGEL